MIACTDKDAVSEDFSYVKELLKTFPSLKKLTVERRPAHHPDIAVLGLLLFFNEANCHLVQDCLR